MSKQITAQSISEQQIKSLRREAVDAHDFDQVAVCDLALSGGRLHGPVWAHGEQAPRYVA